jgi:hypothetical protein
MARGEISGRKPKQSAERAKRKPGPPRLVDPSAIEPTPHDAPDSNASTKAKPIRGSPTALFSIKSFCVAHGISEGFYFELRKQGLGPHEMRLGARVFITFESAAKWRAEREAVTAAAATAALEQGGPIQRTGPTQSRNSTPRTTAVTRKNPDAAAM